MPLLVNGESLQEQILADGLPRQAVANDGSRHVLYLERGFVRSMPASEWSTALPNDPSPAESAAAAAVLKAAADQAEKDAVNLRQRIVQEAQSAVGQSISTLTTSQLRALVVILLWREGAVDKDGVIRPLGQWVRQ